MCCFVCLFVCLFACLLICVSVCLCVCVCLSVCQSICLSVCLSVCLSICLSVCLSVCLSPRYQGLLDEVRMSAVPPSWPFGGAVVPLATGAVWPTRPHLFCPSCGAWHVAEVPAPNEDLLHARHADGPSSGVGLGATTSFGRPRLSVCLFVCLFVCLPVSLPVCLPVCLSV